MSKYKLEFTLKQHTPLIHFQHDQDGATLRATELKPKLDRFLIQKLGLTQIVQKNGKEKEVPKEEFKHWFINDGKEHLALDYKVRIEAKEKNTNVWMEPRQNRQRKWETKFPTFFANMGKESKEELVNFTYYNDIKAFITCFIPKLKTKIDNHFPEFLFKTNFGTRQSKGFGSFTTEKESDKNTPYLLVVKKETLDGKNYIIDPNISFRDIFEIIHYYHQRLKSGINYSYYNKNNRQPFCHYKKAFIREYVLTKYNYEWDKKWLKEKFLGIKSNNHEKKFVRALLGLAYDFRFTKKRNPCNPKGILPKYEVEVSIDTNEKEIQRIKSPILYKPIKINNEWRIYILIDDEYLQKNKQLVSDYKFDFIGNGKIEQLETPNEIFDFLDLISEYHKHLGNTFEVVNFTGNNKYKIEIK